MRNAYLRYSLVLALLAFGPGCARRDSTAQPAPPSSTTAPSAPSELGTGRPAPDFTATAHDGTKLHLAELVGHPVIIYFYPKDETPGCTKEACAFRDVWEPLKKSGAVLIGISADSDESHRDFAKNHSLPFHLVSDPNGTIAKSFGVPMHAGFISRQTIVIGSDGKLKKIYRNVDVSKHAQEIADDVK